MMVQWEKHGNKSKNIASMRVECGKKTKEILERNIDDV